MKSYDFKKAVQIIEHLGSSSIESASLGMHEDWFWTAEEIFKEGKFLKTFPENPGEVYAEYQDKRESGMFFLDAVKEYNNILIGGLYSSDWATPTLQVIFKDGTDKMFPCYLSDGKEIPFGEKVEIQIAVTSGPISTQVQSNITPLEK